jgi:hypothetical protein
MLLLLTEPAPLDPQPLQGTPILAYYFHQRPVDIPEKAHQQVQLGPESGIGLLLVAQIEIHLHH